MLLTSEEKDKDCSKSASEIIELRNELAKRLASLVDLKKNINEP
jgi:hypothetical protein